MPEDRTLRTRSYYDGADYHPTRSWIDGPNDLPNDGQVHYEPSISTFHTFSNYVLISDNVNPKGQDGMRAVSPCTHLRIAQTFSRFVPNHVKCQGGYQYQMFPSGLKTHINPDMVEAFFPSVPTAPIFEAGIQAFNKFDSQLPKIVELANFIYELREWKDMIPKLTKNIRKIPHAANNNFLSFSFAWKPFISDLAKFTSLFSKVSDRIDWLRKNRGKLVPVRYAKKGIYDDPAIDSYTDPWVVYGWSSGGEEYFRGKLLRRDVDFFASCKLYQTLDGLDDAWAFLRGLIAATGLNNPAKIIWNAIPFSFILDWFVPFGDLLERVAVKPFTGTWRITDTTHSVKQTLRYSISHYYDGGPCGVGYKDDPISTIDVIKYERKLGLPTSLSDFLDLDSNKQALLASLAFSFTEHKRRPHKGAKK